MVLSNLLDVLRKKWEEVGANAHVTIRTLVLGARDATTGWYEKTFDIDSLERAYIIPRGLQQLLLPPGYYTKYDAVAFYGGYAEMFEGDEIEDRNNNFYRVDSVKRHLLLDKQICYEAHLELMPLHPERAAEAPPTKLTGRKNFFATLISHYKRMTGTGTADVTDYTFLLDVQDPDTGWYTKTWTHSTIEMVIIPSNQSISNTPVGVFTASEFIGYTQDDVRDGDLIYRALDDLFFVIQTRTPLFIGEKLVIYKCTMSLHQAIVPTIDSFEDGPGGGGFPDDWDIGTTQPCGGVLPYVTPTVYYDGANSACIPQCGWIGQSYLVYVDADAVNEWYCQWKTDVPGGCSLEITIEYSDATETVWTETTTDNNWHEIDLHAHLVAGKEVVRYSLWCPNGSARVYVDYFYEVWVAAA